MRASAPFLGLVFAFVLAMEGGAEPYTPRSADEIIGTSPTRFAPAAEREWRTLRARLSAEPTNAVLAAQVVRGLVERSRATGDPRHLGYAEAALHPWADAAEPPLELLVLRATVAQSLHRFEPARVDLLQAVRRDPGQAQAWLTLATLDILQGRFDRARAACLKLLQLGQDFSAVTLAANLGSMTGQAAPAAVQLQSAIVKHPDAGPALRRWATTLLAEIHARLDQPAEAEVRFREALALGSPDTYLLGAWADFLLDQRRPAEVIAFLSEHRSQEALLLRLAEAHHQRGSAEDLAVLPKLLARLESDFTAARLRPDFIHHREEARYRLRLKDDPAGALDLALENWALQREPIDVRLVLDAAVAARRPDAAEPVLAWVREHRYQDAALRPALAALATNTVAARNAP